MKEQAISHGVGAGASGPYCWGQRPLSIVFGETPQRPGEPGSSSRPVAVGGISHHQRCFILDTVSNRPELPQEVWNSSASELPQRLWRSLEACTSRATMFVPEVAYASDTARTSPGSLPARAGTTGTTCRVNPAVEPLFRTKSVPKDVAAGPKPAVRFLGPAGRQFSRTATGGRGPPTRPLRTEARSGFGIGSHSHSRSHIERVDTDRRLRSTVAGADRTSRA